MNGSLAGGCVAPSTQAHTHIRQYMRYAQMRALCCILALIPRGTDERRMDARLARKIPEPTVPDNLSSIKGVENGWSNSELLKDIRSRRMDAIIPSGDGRRDAVLIEL